MTDESSNTDETNSYKILSSYESTLEFYGEASGETPEDALRTAIKENGDDDLLPVKDASYMTKGFIVVPDDEWHTFSHR